jgi:lipopolysaccharide transport system ATP-binding protein
MQEPVISFQQVSKSYPLYHHVRGGIKHFLFNFSKGVRSLREENYEALRDISFEVTKARNSALLVAMGLEKVPH